MSSPSVLQVFVFRSGQYVGSEIFTEPEVVIGRGHGADLHVDEEGVAPNHAILSNKEGRATLLDLGAPGGTRVNRVPIQHCYVTARDEIQVGSFTLKIKFVQAARTSTSSRPESAPPTAAGSPNEAREPEAAHPREPAPTRGLEDLISESLSSRGSADDALDVMGQDVLSSVDMPPTTEADFGNLDDALASAFMSPDETAPPPSDEVGDFEVPTTRAEPPVPLAPESTSSPS